MIHAMASRVAPPLPTKHSCKQGERGGTEKAEEAMSALRFADFLRPSLAIVDIELAAKVLFRSIGVTKKLGWGKNLSSHCEQPPMMGT